MSVFPVSHRWRVLHFSWVAFCGTFLAWLTLSPPLIASAVGLLVVTLAKLSVGEEDAVQAEFSRGVDSPKSVRLCARAMVLGRDYKSR